MLKRLHNQPGVVDYKTEILDHAQVAKMLPDIGPEVVGRQLLPARRPREFAAPVPHAAHRDQRARRRPTCRAIGSRPSPRDGGEFRLDDGAAARSRANRVALAAGNANMRLAPMVGLEAPMRPERGQIVVTERLRPFLHYPVVTLRQTDEGTVMIGDSKEESIDPDRPDAGRQRHRGRARGAPCSRCCANVNVVRTWSAHPGHDPGRLSDLRRVARRIPAPSPSAAIPASRSRANHALTIAPMIARGALDKSLVAPFSARRFHVQEAG